MKQKVLNFTNKLDSALSKVFPKTKPVSDTEKQYDAENRAFDERSARKAPKQGFFKSTFRGDERLKLEAYTMASTEAEKQAILKTMKDFM